ncbi:unnamed protein product [Discosporangium mesarthrocarpum]
MGVGRFEDMTPGEEHGGRGEGGSLMSLSVTKRPRNEVDTFTAKRGRGENGTTLALQTSPVLLAGGRGMPPLLESPGKLNKLAPFSDDSGLTSSKPGTFYLPSEPPGSPTACRRVRVTRIIPKALALRTLAVTDPVFQAALLRLLHRRGGIACPGASGWRWGGGKLARFDHWPRACHPAVMELLAAVSAGEERVALSEFGLHDGTEGEGQLTAITFRSPVPRTDAWSSPASRMQPPPPTPVRSTPATGNGGLSVATPVSANGVLRRAGATPRTANRVRFQTHDMSVIDTPDPSRGGSEEGMMTALCGLQAILTAARNVCKASRNAGSGDCVRDGERETVERGFDDRLGLEGGAGRGGEYFDRFSSLVRGNNLRVKEELESEYTGKAIDSADAPRSLEDTKTEEAALAREGRVVREDMTAVISILGEIARSDTGPSEVEVDGGWGISHYKAAEFYSKELAQLCGKALGMPSEDVAELGTSYLRKRFLDVLSCLVRFNLKVLLNTCSCDDPPGLFAEDPEEARAGAPSGPKKVEEGEPPRQTEEGMLPSPPLLTVKVPGRLAGENADYAGCPKGGSSPEGSTGIRFCGCMTVVEGTGTCEFNSEDPAALLTLALRRFHPFQPLAARMIAATRGAGPRSSPSPQSPSSPEESTPATVSMGCPLSSSPSSSSASSSLSEGNGAGSAEEAEDDSTAGSEVESSKDVESRLWNVLREHAAECREAADVTVSMRDPPGAGAGAVSPPKSGNESGHRSPMAVSVSKHEDTSLGLTPDDLSDLLEYTAALRFLFQLLSEPVVIAGVGSGRWATPEGLAAQLRELGTGGYGGCAEDIGGEAGGVMDCYRAGDGLGDVDVLSLGLLGDMRALADSVAAQSTCLPYLDVLLHAEMRRALQRGQGRAQRLKSRLHKVGEPSIMAFPEVKPYCLGNMF